MACPQSRSSCCSHIQVLVKLEALCIAFAIHKDEQHVLKVSTYKMHVCDAGPRPYPGPPITLAYRRKTFFSFLYKMQVVRPGTHRLVLVEVSLLEVAELGLQVLEVLCDALVLLCQPDVGLCILLLMLSVPLLQSRPPQASVKPDLHPKACTSGRAVAEV